MDNNRTIYKDRPDISIIIPVYNAEQYLKTCLDSVIEACKYVHRTCEIIMVDDGSMDGSGALCDRYSDVSSATEDLLIIKTIHQSNTGQAGARNRGVEAAEGEWISFVDSDDYIHPRYLDILYQTAIINNANISMCGAVFNAREVNENRDPTVAVTNEVFCINEDFFINLYRGTWENKGFKNETVWGKLIRKNIVLDRKFAEGHFCEDAAIMCYWFKEAGRVADCSAQLYYYRDNPTRTMNTFNEKKRRDKLWSLMEMRQFYAENAYCVMREKAEKDFLWQAIFYEKNCPDNNVYKKIRKKRFLQWIWRWNMPLKRKLSSFKEYYFIRT